jgi:hypothetical protein
MEPEGLWPCSQEPFIQVWGSFKHFITMKLTAGGPPLVSRQRLLIQYIHSYCGGYAHSSHFSHQPLGALRDTSEQTSLELTRQTMRVGKAREKPGIAQRNSNPRHQSTSYRHTGHTRSPSLRPRQPLSECDVSCPYRLPVTILIHEQWPSTHRIVKY